MMLLARLRQTSEVQPYRWEGRTVTGRPVAVMFMHTEVYAAIGTRRGGMAGARRRLAEVPTKYRPPGRFVIDDIRKHLSAMGLR